MSVCKPGYATTEFWTTLLSQVGCGVLLGLLWMGKLPSAPTDAQWVLLTGMLGTQAWYTWHRAKAKGAGRVKS